MEDIIRLINEEIEELSLEAKEYSLTINNLKQVAGKVGNKNGEYNIDRLIDFIDQPNTLKQCLSEVPMFDDVKWLIGTINAHKSFLKEMKRRSLVNKKCLGKDFNILSEDTKKLVLRYGSDVLKKGYAQILEAEGKMQAAERDAIEMLGCFCFSVVSNYNLAKRLKDNNYERIKTFKYALERISKKEALLPGQHAAIIELINDKVTNEEERKKAFNNLEKYVNQVNAIRLKKVNSPDVTKKDELVSNEVMFIDDEAGEVKDEEDKEKPYLNYLRALKSFNNFSDVCEFLKAVSHGCNLKIMLTKMIGNLGASKEDELLKAYLTEYCLNLENDEHDDVITDSDDCLVLYYGVLDNKSDVLNDVKSRVPKEYYKDVLKGINIIKSNALRGYKSSYFEGVKRVLKVRVNDIRISYKHICKNVYVILGIFCKKDYHGNEVANVSKRRNKRFVMNEKLIMEFLNNNYFRDNLMAKNDEFEQQLLQMLKTKIK